MEWIQVEKVIVDFIIPCNYVGVTTRELSVQWSFIIGRHVGGQTLTCWLS